MNYIAKLDWKLEWLQAWRRSILGLVGITMGIGATGCGILKPVTATQRHFALTPIATTGTNKAAAVMGIGMGQVKLAPYLFDKSLAVRKGKNEVVYLPDILWAERLDSGLQRVLALNLATMLATDRIRLSTWSSEDVSAGIYVSMQQFDIDTSGHARLVAWWRVLSPGGDKVLKSGSTQLEAAGPSADKDPAGAVATLSELAAQFSREIAEALRTSVRPAADQSLAN